MRKFRELILPVIMAGMGFIVAMLYLGSFLGSYVRELDWPVLERLRWEYTIISSNSSDWLDTENLTPLNHRVDERPAEK